jgi:hypothetical protein
MKKVVAHQRDGKLVKGFTEIDGCQKDISLVCQNGKKVSLDLRGLKAVFFVHDFNGNAERQEFKFSKSQSVGNFVWVSVEMFDGEVLEGRVENKVDFLLDEGFFLYPTDEFSNNEKVLVAKAAVKGFSVLAAS